MRTKSLVAVGLTLVMALAVAPTCALGNTIWDLDTDWNAVSNPGAYWSYGKVDSAGVWTTYTVASSDWPAAGNTAWGTGGAGSPGIIIDNAGDWNPTWNTPTIAFGTTTASGDYLAVKWTAAANTTVDITGFGGSVTSDTVMGLWVNGTKLINDVAVANVADQVNRTLDVAIVAGGGATSSLDSILIPAGNTVVLGLKSPVTDGNWQALNLHIAQVVPEPGTLVLLITGLIGLLAYAWRKRK